uniref:putative glucose-6-phosphate 1-epimerase n=1 Tax=Erigeron canadensis TaxID=72917 RepID=UPI001CB9CA62|nr:putative glucose-6-phosphate 1-epimerase [Erigeron canadensis]
MSTSSYQPLEVTTGINDLPKLILRQTDGSSAEVYLYGAHVTSLKNEEGKEILFVSSKAIFDPPKEIHGGISIRFSLSPDKDTPGAHVSAANSTWDMDTNASSPADVATGVFVDLVLKPTEQEYLRLRRHRFEYRLRVALRRGGELVLTSRIKNTNSDGRPFKFTCGYPAYFSVSDISDIRVEGLETLNYLDNLKNGERYTENGEALTFESEVDKVYLSTPTKLAIVDHKKSRTYVIRKDAQLPDAVVWNPWDKKAKAMADFGNDEYKHMLCAGAARMENPITLKPGDEWIARQELSAVNSSYCNGQHQPKLIIHVM